MAVTIHHLRPYAIAVLLFISLQAEGQFVKLTPERLPDMNIPRFGHSTFSASDELTVVGGHTSGFVLTQTAEYLKDGEWHLIQMTYTHDDGLCVPLSNGKVLLAGGYEKNLGIGQTFEVETYDPETHSFYGFGCLDKKRAHVTGIEIDSGQVAIAGNWYNDDAIATYTVGEMYFNTVKSGSVPRSFPYLLRTSNDIMVVSGLWDNYGHPINSGVVDRLKGESFNVSLLETWHPILIGSAPRPDANLIGDIEKGGYAYLIPVQDSTGQVAIAEVRDTVFTLLPTEKPVPMASPWDKIGWYTPIVVDREAQRGYMLGSGTDSIARKYLLSIDYSQRPAQLTTYYTDTIAGFGGSIPLVMKDGNLVVVGGIDGKSTYFNPSAKVWLLPVSPNRQLSSLHNPQSTIKLIGIILLALLLLTLLAYIIIKWARRTIVEHPTEAPKPTSELVQRIEALMTEKQMFLNSNLKMLDIATALDVHQNEVSSCINLNKGYSFSQFVNGYRVEYAKQLMLSHPSIKMAQVAIESGFSSDTSFFRTFKSLTGMSPSEWTATQQ